MTKNKKIYLILNLFLLMLVLSISFSFRGLFIPAFKEEFVVKGKHIGIFLSVLQLVAMAAYIIGNFIVEKIGQKRLIQIGILINIITFFLITYSKNFIIFTIGYSFITLGYNFMLFGLNTTIPLINVSFQALLMNLLHGFFGVGNTVSQKLTGVLLVNNFTWKDIFQYTSFLYLIVFVIYLFATNLKDKKIKAGDREIKQKKILILFIFAIGLYVSAEIQTGNWFMNLLRDHYEFKPNVAVKYTTVFFATFTIGRFLGGLVTEKLGYFKSIIYSLFFAIILNILGMLLKEKGLYIIASGGIFLSIIYPTTVVIMGKVFKKNSSRAIALMSTFVAVFVLSSGLLIGFLNDYIGQYLSFYTISICMILSLITYYYLDKQIDTI
ncbi:MAG: MFS transporter [Bacillota bacterium]